MKRSLHVLVGMLACLLASQAQAGPVLGIPSTPSFQPPSTNELNYNRQVPGRIDQDAPYVILVGATSSSITLEFHNPATGQAFFEYRLDGNALTPDGTHPVVGTNLNHLKTGLPGFVDDDVYPGIAVTSGNVVTQTFNVTNMVEVRLALGGERDWDFDWTAFTVVPIPAAAWAGMALLGGLGGVRWVRRRQA